MKKLLLLSIISGVLLSLAWPAGGFAPLLFVSLIPLLYVEDFIYRNPERYNTIHLFGYCFLAFFCWNLFTTWWVYNASAVGAIIAIVFNTLHMAIVFTLFHFRKEGTMFYCCYLQITCSLVQVYIFAVYIFFCNFKFHATLETNPHKVYIKHKIIIVTIYHFDRFL